MIDDVLVTFHVCKLCSGASVSFIQYGLVKHEHCGLHSSPLVLFQISALVTLNACYTLFGKLKLKARSLLATVLCGGRPSASSSLLRPGADSVSERYFTFHIDKATWEHVSTTLFRSTSICTTMKINMHVQDTLMERQPPR